MTPASPRWTGMDTSKRYRSRMSLSGIIARRESCMLRRRHRQTPKRLSVARDRALKLQFSVLCIHLLARTPPTAECARARTRSLATNLRNLRQGGDAVTNPGKPVAAAASLGLASGIPRATAAAADDDDDDAVAVGG
ncbi:hypothetical protein HPB50_000052 [Hyalomma asiaticum]|uniref:Uncharacterized protein n=1 Tax=Hyalomma asiaticum TaxID=266040 RepID=A0ACB7SRU0_HYAAI|nr:hypothetical protein HPB50_000052 [Hyalomma asiaticum]